MSVYTLSKIKTFNGHEGQGLNATLLKDGKPVAFILDDANGGEVDFDFRNPGQNAKSYEQHKGSAQAEEQAFAAFALNWYTEVYVKTREAAVFAERYGHDTTAPTEQCAMEMWVADVVDAIDTKRQLDRMAKKKTLFRIKGESYAEGEYRTIKEPYSPRVQQYLDKKYPGQVEAIYGVTP